jgi:hypothetical protein
VGGGRVDDFPVILCARKIYLISDSIWPVLALLFLLWMDSERKRQKVARASDVASRQRAAARERRAMNMAAHT